MTASTTDDDAPRSRPGVTPAPRVAVDGVGKTFRPSPGWMRVLLRSAISSPVTALEDLSFEVAAGQICAVVGPNGAGKSTLFRILVGLTTPDTGTATVMGLDCAEAAPLVRRKIGFQPADDRSLYLRHSCRENLLFHGRLQGLPDKLLKARIPESLEQVGLGHAIDRVGFALSAGMRARLQLARALLHNPAVLILDEPTGAIDPVGSHELLQTIQRIVAERDLAVLISSHRLEEIEALGDHLLLMDGGRRVYWGDLASLRKHWERPRLELDFVDAAAVAQAAIALASLADVDVQPGGELTLSVGTTSGPGEVLSALSSQARSITAVREHRLSLRDLLNLMLARGQQ